MIIMGLDDEYAKAMSHVATVDFHKSNDNSKTFETTIRYLGGLLAANDLRPDPILVKQALALVEYAIMPAFNTTNGVPASYVNVNTGNAVVSNSVNLAEFGSVQLEMTRLSQVINNSKYEDIANAVVKKVQSTPANPPGVYGITWTEQPFNPEPSSTITISGGGDSYYEYLLKTYLLMDSKDDSLMSSWTTFVDTMKDYLQQEDQHLPFTYVADMTNGNLYSDSGELICFAPGNIIYGAKLLSNKDYADLAGKLMDGCYQIWQGTETKIAPESFHWIPKGASLANYTASQVAQDEKRGFYFSQNEASYNLRPETVESLFYFYRITGDKSYQDKAWDIFTQIEKYCRTPNGYSNLNNVDSANPGWGDFQESYLFAETFKYLYLIFSDTSTVSLNEWVFNTEAHPFKLPSTLNIQI
ncbi:glycoside hydrolase [Umbelopsis sp. PMI_123]|nr:glycoside hydrolase [Umbelopsis sp. PMI_123]